MPFFRCCELVLVLPTLNITFFFQTLLTFFFIYIILSGSKQDEVMPIVSEERVTVVYAEVFVSAFIRSRTYWLMLSQSEERIFLRISWTWSHKQDRGGCNTEEAPKKQANFRVDMV